MSRPVGVLIDDGVEWHAPGVISDYDTLCGVDANDSVVGTYGAVVASRGQKISCQNCHTIWKNTIALALRRASFDESLE